SSDFFDRGLDCGRQPNCGVCVEQDHLSASHSTSIGEMISPLMFTLPFHMPRGLRFGTRCGTSSTSGFPFLVITMGLPVSATSSIRAKHLALNSEALMMRDMRLSLL